MLLLQLFDFKRRNAPIISDYHISVYSSVNQVLSRQHALNLESLEKEHQEEFEATEERLAADKQAEEERKLLGISGAHNQVILNRLIPFGAPCLTE